MVKTKNLILASSIIIVCAGAFLLLLASSSVPLFTVKELKDHPQPESYINKKIQLIGNINQIIETNFTLTDPDDPNNESLIIYVEAINIGRPSGFVLGKIVLVEGKLLSIGNVWIFKASMISTKCPSKYN
jgi:hypothetical protein